MALLISTIAGFSTRRRRGAPWRRFWLILAGGVLASAARADVSKEYQLKAAFLYNFTKFVEWPAQRFADDTSPIVIGVFGRNPFGGELEKIVQGRTVNGRAILVKILAPADPEPAVHLLFVPAGEEARVPAAWQRTAVLTVGESPRFAAQGGIITLVVEGDNVRFEIDLEAAQRNGLKISAQLQKLAKTIRRHA